MPEQCEECREEKGYDEIIVLKCDLGYEHCICEECMKAIKKKAKK
jgi:hypothetical protein